MELVRGSITLSDVVKQHVDLEDKGDGQWMGCCPFHDDNSPSMSVSDEKGVYHCFSCGASGDVFKFVSEKEGMSFPEALEYIAEEGGIDLVKEGWKGGGGGGASGAIKESHMRLHKALELASEYYASMLVEVPGGLARTHLREREISARLATEFSLGYSPATAGGLLQHLRPLKLTEDELVKSGLFASWSVEAMKANRAPSDRMGGRLVIPIRNARGQMVGFSGRLLHEGERSAKYINTPETPIFKKKNVLYGLERANCQLYEKL